KIVLLNTKPPVWRRVLIKDDITFEDLHRTIQNSMPWSNSHLHSFDFNGQTYEADNHDDFGLFGDDDENKGIDVKLSSLQLGEKDRIGYTYDFGDDWQHQILIEKVIPIDINQDYPFCIKATGACPPEDCGGIWGFYEMVEAVKDKKSEMREEYIELLGKNFDPKYINIDEINDALRSMMSKIKTYS
ncbi:MAG: plasmid pRiA4b ORF-3 family protein, partial [Candidatus Margulisbacteria bacterium]|nr:plasmid pRiA4b ORF-3 family protein [Candidatus Margulisiibacteriota bacterium]